MNWIDKCSQADECATIGDSKISRLLFADVFVLLSSTESGLQRALCSFADACDTTGMKISAAKTEVLHLSRNPDQCVLQVNGAKLKQVEKFKYLGVAFTSDGRQDEELDTRIGKAGTVMRALYYLVVMKQEFLNKAKLSVFKAVFVRIITYGQECWVMIERVRPQVQACEMWILRRIEGVTLFNKVRSSQIRKSPNGSTFTSRTFSGREAPKDSQIVIQRYPCGVRVLGRGARSKNKRQSPPASPSGSFTNVRATRLEGRMEAVQSICTRDSVAHSRVNCHQLLLDDRNIFTLTGKELELVEEAKRHHLDVIGVSSTKRRGSGTLDLDGGWKLFYSGADPGMSAQASMGILTSHGSQT